MDTNPAKRRKLDHQAPLQSDSNSAAALDAAAGGGTSRPSTFVLQTQELLEEVRLDLDRAFPGAEDLLHRIKSTIQDIQPLGPTPVSSHMQTASSPPCSC